ncbi:uncharacterized protein LOC118414935 isoform X1 [Branchiostoma floridae]|uniref:Uncharacterized protein LOC118414935 isoform X1 n=1 Tax=Branchiostoma floridae TaxID=7739 RepID=A0A9J7L3V7_BRAFL|nr:uncharacterized protein LOC118414935 isoform X1 [Branchiostoma floridae]XP_035675166.1 uncharacterized protein LOC118414935 isoform X1 [Branchiostoma floridae]
MVPVTEVVTIGSTYPVVVRPETNVMMVVTDTEVMMVVTDTEVMMVVTDTEVMMVATDTEVMMVATDTEGSRGERQVPSAWSLKLSRISPAYYNSLVNIIAAS